jgi:signal transduction histidine kinase/ABC-type nitrate/sulfonate/bicarbonate transport system substrate-binding protein
MRLISRQLIHLVIFCCCCLPTWPGNPLIREVRAVSDNDDVKSLETVTLQLKWYHQFQFAGYYAAIAKGYYEEAGLAVRFIEYQPDMDLVEPVVSGRVNFGIAGSEAVVSRMERRRVVVLAALFQHSPVIVMTLRNSGLTTPQDLIGKRLMWSNTIEIGIPAMLRLEGIRLDQIQIQEASWNIDDLIDGRTDALSGYVTNQPFFFEQRGIPLNIIYPHRYGADFYGDCLITSETEINRDPRRVERFRQASLAGWRYAMQHPEELVDHILEQYGSRRTREHLLYEAAAMETLIVPDLVEIGHINPGRWETIAEQYQIHGVAPQTYSLEGFIYDPLRIDSMILPRRYIHLLIVFAFMVLTGAGMLLFFNRRLSRVVGQRTAELSAANRSLTQEVDERRRAESELRVAKEVAEAANVAKSQFLAAMSHELRTPLHGIIGFADVLEHQYWGPLTERQQEFVKDISDSGNHLLLLINDILDVAKIEAGKIELDRVPANLTDMIEDSLSFIRHQSDKTGIDIRLTIPESLRTVTVMADRRRFRQIMLNLLSNAVKYTPENGLIEVGIDQREKDFCVFVRDNGIGIRPEDQLRIFDGFYQVQNDEIAKTNGTGLGLSIVKQLVALHGGVAWVDSGGPGAGSVFSFTLPIDRTA